tara:strand:- start:133 stop:1008 length:876 start_codon:yes stop_codon:yes gene_type:complete
MLYLFNTKRGTRKYLEEFAKGNDNKFFDFAETNGPKFYNQHWPMWNGQFQDENVEVCFQGIIRGTKRLQTACQENDIPYYYFDQPYLFYNEYQPHPAFGQPWYRVIKNNVQMIDVDIRHKERFDYVMGMCTDKETIDEVTLKDWKTGDHILIIPPSEHTANWYDMKVDGWVDGIINQLQKYTDRPIRVRYKYENKRFGKRNIIPLKEDLKNCHAMVSWHSMAACEAVIAGIPSFTSEHSPANMVSYSLNDLDKIEQPLKNNREVWLWSLIGNQFMLSELTTDYAYKYINGG